MRAPSSTIRYFFNVEKPKIKYGGCSITTSSECCFHGVTDTCVEQRNDTVQEGDADDGDSNAEAPRGGFDASPKMKQ